MSSSSLCTSSEIEKLTSDHNFSINSSWHHPIFKDRRRRVIIPGSRLVLVLCRLGIHMHVHHAHTRTQQANTGTPRDGKMLRMAPSTSRNQGITDWTVKINLCSLHWY